eukprot:5682161-Amphidinium_carterae.1
MSTQTGDDASATYTGAWSMQISKITHRAQRLSGMSARSSLEQPTAHSARDMPCTQCHPPRLDRQVTHSNHSRAR